MTKTHQYNFRRAILVLLIFFGLAGTHLFISTTNIALKYKLTEQKLTLAELSSQNKLLAIKVVRGENLNIIEKTAQEKLDMHYPEVVNYIVKHPRTETGNLAKASPKKSGQPKP